MSVPGTTASIISTIALHEQRRKNSRKFGARTTGDSTNPPINQVDNEDFDTLITVPTSI